MILLTRDRIMQAISRDDIFPIFRFFKTGSAHGDEPRRAMVLTYLVAQAWSRVRMVTCKDGPHIPGGAGMATCTYGHV